jgi:hypothetical protein
MSLCGPELTSRDVQDVVDIGAGAYLLRYAQEESWRKDNRCASNGEQANRLAGLAMKNRPSADFSGYWQRHISAQ